MADDNENEVQELRIPMQKKALEYPTDVVAAAPSTHDILARPAVYEEWLAKLKESANG